MTTVHVDVWVYDAALTRTVLVEHPNRGWVMPGGKAEPGETALQAAVRELREETGIDVGPSELVAIASEYGRDPLADGDRLRVSFALVLDADPPLSGEPGRPPRWWDLDDHWPTVFPRDRLRLRAAARPGAMDVHGLMGP